MALVTYRVWYGCRVDNVAYKRGVVVQLDDTSASVQYNVGKGRLRPTSGEVADGSVVNDDIIGPVDADKIDGTAIVAGASESVLSVVKLTQAEYDALATKVATTLYVIVG